MAFIAFRRAAQLIIAPLLGSTAAPAPMGVRHGLLGANDSLAARATGGFAQAKTPRLIVSSTADDVVIRRQPIAAHPIVDFRRVCLAATSVNPELTERDQPTDRGKY
ncbi:hypothetical protein ACWDTD_19925 [Gordonia sp. NPDC003425]